MQWKKWLHALIASNARVIDDVSVGKAYLTQSDCSLSAQITLIQQEQIKLSKDILEIRHMVHDMIEQLKILSKDVSRIGKNGLVSSSSIQMKNNETSTKTLVPNHHTTISPSVNACTDCINNTPHSKIRPMDILLLDEMELYTSGSTFYWISNSYKILLPDKPWKQKCKLAILISSGPYSGSDIIMEIVSAWLDMIHVSFRGSAMWNYHAHSNMSMEQSQLWLNDFHTWLHSLKRGDIVILQTPFYQEDGNVARRVCQDSFIIHSLQSLQDMALLHRFPSLEHVTSSAAPVTATDGSINGSQGPVSDPRRIEDRKTLDYLRQVLSHQKRWRDDANLTIGWGEFQNPQKLIQSICQGLIQKHLGLADAYCEDNNEVIQNKWRIKNNETMTMDSYQEYIKQIDRLKTIKQSMDQDQSLFLKQVESNFYHWIFTESKSNDMPTYNTAVES